MDCDNCGKPIQDGDEILCRKCKPSLQRDAEVKKAEDAISEAYWKFSRCARAKPPSLVVPWAYEALKKYKMC